MSNAALGIFVVQQATIAPIRHIHQSAEREHRIGAPRL
jgi:hypothetical protein